MGKVPSEAQQASVLRVLLHYQVSKPDMLQTQVVLQGLLPGGTTACIQRARGADIQRAKATTMAMVQLNRPAFGQSKIG